MPILQIPIASAIAWLLAFAFTGAGIFNAMGGAVVQAQFLRWGYPAWWNFITAALETLSAALIVLPETRIWGLALGAMVLIAAVSTVTWHREYEHLPPGVALAALTVIGDKHGEGQAWGQVKYRCPGTRRRWVMIIWAR
jgi:DoxX-like family